MKPKILRMIDWFIPDRILGERTELPVWRNFVFTHFAGPLLCQTISIFLYVADTTHGFACWAMIIGIWAFWGLPFVLKFSQSITLSATLSVQMLCLASLGGSFFYGGVNSPFLPWILVAVLLGFFYLSERPSSSQSCWPAISGVSRSRPSCSAFPRLCRMTG